MEEEVFFSKKSFEVIPSLKYCVWDRKEGKQLFMSIMQITSVCKIKIGDSFSILMARPTSPPSCPT